MTLSKQWLNVFVRRLELTHYITWSRQWMAFMWNLTHSWNQLKQALHISSVSIYITEQLLDIRYQRRVEFCVAGKRYIHSIPSTNHNALTHITFYSKPAMTQIICIHVQMWDMLVVESCPAGDLTSGRSDSAQVPHDSTALTFKASLPSLSSGNTLQDGAYWPVGQWKATARIHCFSFIDASFALQMWGNTEPEEVLISARLVSSAGCMFLFPSFRPLSFAERPRYTVGRGVA